MSDAALGITRSIAGQPWHWRRASADMAGENLAPDDLVTQLLLARDAARRSRPAAVADLARLHARSLAVP